MSFRNQGSRPRVRAECLRFGFQVVAFCRACKRAYWLVEDAYRPKVLVALGIVFIVYDSFNRISITFGSSPCTLLRLAFPVSC